MTWFRLGSVWYQILRTRWNLAEMESNINSKQDQGMSLWRYLLAEVSRGYILQQDQLLYSEKQRRINTFMKTPRELEKLMLFGFFICMDAFLFVFTFLPIRVLVALLSCCVRVLTCARQWLEPAQKCDLMRASILILGCVGMTYVDTSALYHIVRGQSVIKLYVIYNMLEIFDRLLASIGQDTLDTLYWTAVENKSRKREHFETLFYFVIANAYVMVHTVVVLVQAVTLNVALNSHNKALLTILVSNNFVELKGSVFKKFETNNLFQMSCSDIRERFHNVVMLLIVCVRNLAQFKWDLAYLELLLPVVVVVLVSEVVVDWVKHAFITKFNDISPDVYCKYRAILSKDLATCRHKNAKSDHSDMVSRRMGFIPLPLGCVVWRTLSQSLTFPGLTGAVLLVVSYLCLMALKVLLGIVLLGNACNYRYTDTGAHGNESQKPSVSGQSDHVTQGEESHLRHRKASAESEADSKPTGTPQKKPSKPLDDIERFTLCSNRIV